MSNYTRVQNDKEEAMLLNFREVEKFAKKEYKKDIQALNSIATKIEEIEDIYISLDQTTKDFIEDEFTVSVLRNVLDIQGVIEETLNECTN